MHRFSRVKLMCIFGLLIAIVISLTLFGSTRGISHASGTLTQSSTQTEATTATTISSCGAWTVIPSPPVRNSYLSGVAPVSANDVWAVGDVAYPISRTLQTLAENWNGSSWSVIPSPNPGSKSNVLRAVSAISKSDVWAVGYLTNRNIQQTLIEHWDGTSWNVIPSPNAGQVQNDLYGISGSSAGDVWAVGLYSNSLSNPKQPLIEHWNGTSWSIIPSPTIQWGYLQGVVTLSDTNAWIVGTEVYDNKFSQTLTEHWNGTSWSIIPSRNPSYVDEFVGVAPITNTDQIWAVGAHNQYSSKTLTERWDGTAWRMISSPNILSRDYLNGVAASSKGNAWAVGWYINTDDNSQTLIEQWNGATWSTASTPNVSGTLQAVGWVPGTSQFWAVGVSYNNSSKQQLIEFYC